MGGATAVPSDAPPECHKMYLLSHRPACDGDAGAEDEWGWARHSGGALMLYRFCGTCRLRSARPTKQATVNITVRQEAFRWERAEGSGCSQRTSEQPRC